MSLVESLLWTQQLLSIQHSSANLPVFFSNHLFTSGVALIIYHEKLNMSIDPG